MQAYPEYKASGVDWLGDIPSDWECMKIKRLTVVKRGASPRPIDDKKYFDENGEFAWVRIADVTASERYLENTTQRLSKLGSSLSVKRYPGDFFLSIAATVGKPIITKIKCCIHDGFVWFPYLKTNPEFLYYLFSTGLPYQGLGKWGTQLNLNTDTVGDIVLPIPKANDINSIINFLDYKTGLIDKFIANRQKQIELLKEQKAAIINKAVTKGINPQAKMKASGIEWIGDMPEDWQVWKLKFITKKIGSGVTPLGGSQVYKTEGVAFFRSQNIYNDKLELSNISFIDEETHQDMKNSQIEFGDVLLNITGASIGRCFFFSGEYQDANVNQHVCIIRSNKKILFQFLHSVMISEIGQNQIFSKQSGTNREGLNFEQLKNFNIPLPEKEEQQLILNYIKIENTKIDNLSSKYQKQIELMREYKTALISQAVTGKIDVRNWQPKNAIQT